MGPRQTTDDTRIIVVEADEQKVGIIVDEVIEVTVLSEDDVQPPPEAIGALSRLVTGVAKQGNQLLILLDLHSFLLPPRAWLLKINNRYNHKGRV